jgi:hypothetical protein
MVQSESGVVAYGPKDKSRMPNFSGLRNGPKKKRRRRTQDGRERERERVVASGPKAKSRIPNFSVPRKRERDGVAYDPKAKLRIQDF